MNAPTNTTFRVDAAMDVLLPRRRSDPMPRNRHPVDDFGLAESIGINPQRTNSSIFR